MHSSFATCLPLFAGGVYALSAVFMKRATAEGGGIWRVTFLSNWIQALVLLPFAFGGGAEVVPRDWLHIGITALVYLAGQGLVFSGLRFGDVSVVTPVMGVKVLIVAVMATGLGQEKLPALWWIAAGLSAGAAALLGQGGGGPRRNLGWSMAAGIGAAAAFALVDILFQRWGNAVGVWRFSALVSLSMGVWSLALLPLLEGPWWAMPAPAVKAFAPGVLLGTGQLLLMAYSVMALGGATWANLLYSSRGVWSVLLVWGFGKALGTAESDCGRTAMTFRLAGSGLMLGAIALVLH